MKNLNTKITVCFAIIMTSFFTHIKAQSDSIKYDFELISISSTGNHSPFWLHSNSYGLTSLHPNSLYFNAGFSKAMLHPTQLFDYEYKINASINTDFSSSKILLHEYFAKARLSVFGLRIGAMKEHYGNQDATLSSGGLLFSKNARPMPKIWAGTENFTPIPFTGKYLEIKGGISHGWFIDDRYAQNALLHHKYLYLRAGGKLPINIQYGVDHVAQWGGNAPVYGQQPDSFSDFKRIFLAQSGSESATKGDQINTLGNHIVSQSMKIELNLANYKVDAYWQNISEDGPIRPLWKSMNRSDGLWGISVKNNQLPLVQGILYEYVNTTDQSGPYHDKDGIVYGGSDSYFNNSVYKSGWSYYARTIGTPFILSPMYHADGAVRLKNTRIQAHHIGVEGSVGLTNYRALATFLKTYGNYTNLGGTNPPKTLNSFLVEVSRPIPKVKGLVGTISINNDYGNFNGKSLGVLIGIKKRGNLFSY